MSDLTTNSQRNINQTPSERWHQFVATLNWGRGNRDSAAFKAFLRAGSLGIDAQAAMREVTRLIQSTGGTFDSHKLQSQLRRAYVYAGSEQGTIVTVIQPLVLNFDPELLRMVAADAPGITREWLKTHSPIPPTDLESAAILSQLYKNGEKVLVFEDLHSQGEHLFTVGGENAPLPKLTAEGVWYLINPVDGDSHPNPRQENRPSRRSEESITSWKYVLLESDIEEQDQWLACLVQLPLKISAIYSSGNRSMHALVRVDAVTKAEWDINCAALKSVMVPLGADVAAMTGVRLSRLPGAFRGVHPQELLYLNPNPTGKPIIL